jgi:hypothetical protein
VLLKDNGVVTGAGTVSAPVYSTTGDLNTGIFFPAADTIAFAEGGAEAMRIDSSGNVGIGTSSPGSKLDVVGTITTDGLTSEAANGTITSKASSGFCSFTANTTAGSDAYVFFQQAGTEFARITAENGSAILFSNGSGATERMRITSSGNVGIGTTSPAGRLGVERNIDDNVLDLRNSTSSVTGPSILRMKYSGASPDNNTAAFIYADDSSNILRFVVWSDGDVQNHDNSYGGTSDVKLKQDIVDASSQWDDIKSLRVRKFKFKSDVEVHGNDASYLLGLVAQEAELVSPGLIKESDDYEEVEVPVLDEEGNPVLDEEGNPQVTTERVAAGTVTKGVKYSILYMKAVKALQEAMERIETLEAKNDTLEARLSALEQA